MLTETFYRLEALNDSVIENTKGPLVVRIHRSGDIGHATTVQLNISELISGIKISLMGSLIFIYAVYQEEPMHQKVSINKLNNTQICSS